MDAKPYCRPNPIMSATVRDSMILYKQITKEIKFDRVYFEYFLDILKFDRCILDCVVRG